MATQDEPVCPCGTYSILRFGQVICPCQSRWLFEAGVMTDGKFLIPVGHIQRVRPHPRPPRPPVDSAMRTEDI